MRRETIYFVLDILTTPHLTYHSLPHAQGTHRASLTKINPKPSTNKLV
jgi:hypothetical protein